MTTQSNNYSNSTKPDKKETPRNGNKGRIQEKKSNMEVSLSRTDNRFPAVKPEDFAKQMLENKEIILEKNGVIFRANKQENELLKETKDNKPYVLGNYLNVTHYMTNENGQNPHARIEFLTRRDKRLKSLIVSITDVQAGRNVVEALSFNCFGIKNIQTQGGYKDFYDYINFASDSAQLARGTESLNWLDDYSAFVFPNNGEAEIISHKECEPTFYIGPQKGFPRYSTKGTLDGWLKHAGEICKHSRIGAFMVGLSLAPTLLNLNVGIEGGLMYLFGDSGKGKSTMGELALSVWGIPKGKKSDLYCFNATAVGIDSFVCTHDGFPVIFDELAQLPKKTELQTLAYMVGNGQGRERANPDGSRQEAPKFTVLGMATGERSLKEFAEKELDEGARQRMAEIPLPQEYDTVSGEKRGVFEQLPIDSIYRERANETNGNPYKILGDQIKGIEHYGILGREFVKRLVNEVAGDPENYRNRIKSYITRWIGTNVTIKGDSNSSANRVASRMALASFAGEEAIRYGLFTTSQGEQVLQAGDFERASSYVYSLWENNFKTPEMRREEAIEALYGSIASGRAQFHIYANKQGRYELYEPSRALNVSGALVIGYNVGIDTPGEPEMAYILAKSDFINSLKNRAEMSHTEIFQELKKRGLLKTDKGRLDYKFPTNHTPFKNEIPNSRFYAVVIKPEG